MSFRCRSCGNPITNRVSTCPSCGKRIVSPGLVYYVTLLYPSLLVSALVIAIVSGLSAEGLTVAVFLVAIGGVVLSWVRRRSPVLADAQMRPSEPVGKK